MEENVTSEVTRCIHRVAWRLVILKDMASQVLDVLVEGALMPEYMSIRPQYTMQGVFLND